MQTNAELRRRRKIQSIALVAGLFLAAVLVAYLLFKSCTQFPLVAENARLSSELDSLENELSICAEKSKKDSINYEALKDSNLDLNSTISIADSLHRVAERLQEIGKRWDDAKSAKKEGTMIGLVTEAEEQLNYDFKKHFDTLFAQSGDVPIVSYLITSWKDYKYEAVQLWALRKNWEFCEDCDSCCESNAASPTPPPRKILCNDKLSNIKGVYEKLKMVTARQMRRGSPEDRANIVNNYGNELEQAYYELRGARCKCPEE